MNVLAAVAEAPVPVEAMLVPLLPPGTGKGTLMLEPLLVPPVVAVIVVVDPTRSVVA